MHMDYRQFSSDDEKWSLTKEKPLRAFFDKYRYAIFFLSAIALVLYELIQS